MQELQGVRQAVRRRARQWHCSQKQQAENPTLGCTVLFSATLFFHQRHRLTCFWVCAKQNSVVCIYLGPWLRTFALEQPHLIEGAVCHSEAHSLTVVLATGRQILAVSPLLPRGLVNDIMTEILEALGLEHRPARGE